MKVLVEGVVIDHGATTFKGQNNETVGAAWVKVYQKNGPDRPGETAEVWSSVELGVKQGDHVVIECAVRAENGRVKLSRAALVSVNGGAPKGPKGG